MLAGLAVLFVLVQDVPQFPPHYGARPMQCPVGGETFDAPALMHYSTFGSLPDGQPLGSIEFPILLGECPGNGLVVYGKFTPAEVAKLTPIVASDAYQALRTSETHYYRAYWLAAALGQDRAPWLLLSATWQAKNAGEPERAKRYMEAFVALVGKLPALSGDLDSIALRARAANALRELGRFDEAESLRGSIAIAADAGGSDGDAQENRQGWGDFVAKLAAPIARRDATRMPIDLLSTEHGASRCLEPENPEPGTKAEPLSPFEASYCKSPKLAETIARFRKNRQQ